MGFTLFGLDIRFYGLIIAASILVAFFLGQWLYKKLGYKDDIGYHILLIGVPLGIIGARVFYVIFFPGEIALFDIRGGGMAIYGAVLMGILAVFIYARIRRVGFFTLTDGLAIVLILAQSIGRWGNFFNQEAYGLEIGFHFFPITVMIGDTPHLATFFYESFFNMVGFVLLTRIFFKTLFTSSDESCTKLQRVNNFLFPKKFGTTTAWYFIFYGLVRSIIEPLRTDSLTFFGESTFILNRINFVLSLLLIAVGVIILVLNHKGLISQNNENLLRADVIESSEEETLPEEGEVNASDDKQLQ